MTEPHQPGPLAIIADCPHEAYLPSFTESTAWHRFWGKGTAPPGGGQDGVEVVCHLSPPEVGHFLLRQTLSHLSGTAAAAFRGCANVFLNITQSVPNIFYLEVFAVLLQVLVSLENSQVKPVLAFAPERVS